MGIMATRKNLTQTLSPFMSPNNKKRSGNTSISYAIRLDSTTAAAQGDLRPEADVAEISYGVDIPPLETSLQDCNTAEEEHIATTTEDLEVQQEEQQPSSHPRARFTSQELLDFWLQTLQNSNANSYNEEAISISSILNLDSTHREGDNRSLIPPSERNFYCTSLNPPQFHFGTEGPGQCTPSHDELTEANITARWKDDYIHRNQILEEWRMDPGLVPEGFEIVREREQGRRVGRGFGRARKKVWGVGRGLGRKLGVKFEGNTLV